MINRNYEENEDKKETHGLLTFLVAGVKYGVAILDVTDVIEMQPITFVPKMPKYIEGVFNLRGKVVPIINMRLRFEKEKIPYDERTCIVVIEVNGVNLGLIIDRVQDVMNVSDDEYQPLPSSKKGNNMNKFLKSIITTDNEIKFVLDCEKLIEG